MTTSPRPADAPVVVEGDDEGRRPRIVDLRPHYERPAIRPIHRHRWRMLTLVTASVDILVLALAALVTTIVVGSPGGGRFEPVILVALWWLGLVGAGLYDRQRTENPVEELRRILYGVVAGAAITLVVSFVVGTMPTRVWVALMLPLALALVLVARRGVRKTVHAFRRRGRLRRRALVIGADVSGAELARALADAPWEGVDVVGFVSTGMDDGRAIPPPSRGEIPVVGRADDLRELTIGLAVSDVFVAPTVAGNGHLGDIVSALDGVPVGLRIAPGLDGFLTSRLSVLPLGDRPLLSIQRVELQSLPRAAKRALDLLLGGFLLLFALPVIGLAAIAVRLDSPGPAFFRQERVGLRGTRFMIWKLRTMHFDAETRRQALAHRNEGGELLFKVRRDPRVTRVGRFLRRTSLDELPQLFNVLRGTMSLVGPRPPLPDEVERYDNRVGRRLLVKPGMTGLWQVSGRNELALEDYIRYDLLYVQNWSIALDVYILAKTIPAVLTGRGAY